MATDSGEIFFEAANDAAGIDPAALVEFYNDHARQLDEEERRAAAMLAHDPAKRDDLAVSTKVGELGGKREVLLDLQAFMIAQTGLHRAIVKLREPASDN